jgi:hypothetical protein
VSAYLSARMVNIQSYMTEFDWSWYSRWTKKNVSEFNIGPYMSIITFMILEPRTEIKFLKTVKFYFKDFIKINNFISNNF